MRNCPRIALCLLIALLSGCAFDRKWRAATRAEMAATGARSPSTDPLAGRWRGKWVSDANGHSGGLRAILTRIDDTSYRADFDASYMGILRFGYGMKLAAAQEPDGAIAFEGSENLGALAGGVYQYKGRADGATFQSTYECRSDHGRFEMSRMGK